MRKPRVPVLMMTTAAAASLLMLAGPTLNTSAPGAGEDIAREQQTILATELARATGGRACVQPEDLPAGTIPEWVAVSPWNGPQGPAGWPSNVVEMVPLDTAWRLAGAGDVAVRCVIV